MIISPYISIYKTDPSMRYCYECRRSNEEKKTWKKEDKTDDWKKNNLEAIKKNYLAGNLRALMNLVNIR